jgi:hypothetical protein
MRTSIPESILVIHIQARILKRRLEEFFVVCFGSCEEPFVCSQGIRISDYITLSCVTMRCIANNGIRKGGGKDVLADAPDSSPSMGSGGGGARAGGADILVDRNPSKNEGERKNGNMHAIVNTRRLMTKSRRSSGECPCGASRG